MANQTNNDWDITTDIYGIVESLTKLKQKVINDEDETTLALGVYGYITDTEAKKIQTSTIMAGQLGNEMFPTRAKLTKNVLTHAIYSNIEGINASPARMTINMGVRVEDFEQNMVNGNFTIDCESPIFIGTYEFHFDYDVILSRTESKITKDSFVYSARYDMDEINRLSNVKDPYLRQPFVIRIGNDMYIVFQATVRQCTIEKTFDKIISESIIENKTYTFSFDNQLADFDVYVTDNGTTTRLLPIPYGSSLGNIVDYCWYLYVTDNTIRVTFDNKSYIPGLNTDIEIKAYTTKGASGVFNYKKVDENDSGIYVDISSEKYNYDKIRCYVIATTDSENGTDRKTKEDLKKLIPKAALSRGSVTTSTDVSNYFNLIDSDINRLVMQKKVDNQFSRIWYGYFVLKDDVGNIVPSNSIMMNIIVDNVTVTKTEDNRYILPSGTIIRYDAEEKIANVIDESLVPVLYSEDYFNDKYYYYITAYNVIINPDPLYTAFYLTITNKYSYYTFNWVNDNAILQFIATRCNFKRNLLTDQHMYKLTFKMAQSISEDYGMYYDESVDEVDKETGQIKSKTVTTNNMRCIIIFYKNGTPYRWKDCDLTNYDQLTFVSSWQLSLETDNSFDDENNIMINNVNVIGYTTEGYGFFEPVTEAKLYILAKFTDYELGRYDLDSMIPGLDGYTVTNVYNIDGGLTLYENFTNVLDTKVYANPDNKNNFQIAGLPVIGLHYMVSEENADYLLDSISEKKAYIDYCLTLLENSMYVDFKFFNTYGPSEMYSIGDKEETKIGHVDIKMKFRASLKSAADLNIKDTLISEIKEYIENLYGDEDWHAPAMITSLMNKYSDQINFLEFMNYNDFRLGLQHITKVDTDNPNAVPEFINVRNVYNVEGNLVPCIELEIVQ